MKLILSSIAVLFFLSVSAQKPCDFSVNVTDSIGTYKSTKEYLVYEKNFAGNATYVFNSIVITDGTPMINFQLIEKSSDFIKAKCLDQNSRLYFQLNNGKIITLLPTNHESCGTLLRDEKGLNTRVLGGYFMFRKEDYQELKSSPISFIRVKFATDVADYIYKKEFKSEMNGEVYQPDSYFVSYFHCLEDKN